MSLAFSDTFLKEASSHATSNKAAVGASTMCGCFYCSEVYPASHVTRFLGDQDACCAECTIDSVLPDASGLPVTDQAFLTAMHETSFRAIDPKLQNDPHA